MLTITRPLARYLVSTRMQDLPEKVRHEGTRAFVNWLGCVLGGSADDLVGESLAIYGEYSGPAQSTVIGRGRRVDALTATLVNTTSNFAHGYNDTHLATVAHPMGAPGSAVFAQAERQKVSGEEFALAMILGVEVACRIGNMITVPPASCHVGLSTHGLTNVFGAAVATGRLIGLNEDQMVWAIGLASLQAAGLRSAYGTMGTKLIAGQAARSGMMSAFLAQRGITCSEVPLEHPKGFAAVFADPPNLPAAIEGLSEEFEILKVAYKPYPCGVVIHPAINACLMIAAMPGFDAAAIDSVELRVHPMTVQLCDRADPIDRIQALTSAQHWAAAALQYRAAGLKQGTVECVRSAEMTALRRRIVLKGHPELDDSAAVVVVCLKDGRKLEAAVKQSQGSLERPMTDAELSDKFRNQATLVLPEDKAEALLEESWRLPELGDVGSLAARYFAA